MKKLAFLFISCTLILSCQNQNNQVDDISQNTSILSSFKNTGLNFSLAKPIDIPSDVINFTKKEGKDFCDKESKIRGIEFFNLPNNPIGIKISNANKNAYILNYIGTPNTTTDVNVELKGFYSETSQIYSLNYTGPVTGNEKFKKNKDSLKKSKSEVGVTFELIQGLPPQNILSSFNDYTEGLKNVLKMVYRPKEIKISEDDIFVYAIKLDGETKAFFFESHFNKVILGERKYADMQIGVAISNDNKIKADYSIVAFNPKTKLNQDPIYKFINETGLNLIQVGEL